MDIGRWLRDLGLDRYAGAFQEAEIDAVTLPELTEDDLRELGLPLGPRKQVLKAIAALRVAPEAARLSPASPSVQAHEAERRQLTVMFVDLVGSTALSARLDPEDMQTVIRAYQNAVADEIARVEGHVAKFMGDGVLAYFGWPHAHEDEAERAARAGLAIAAKVATLTGGGAPMACRIGIATGLVVVGELIGEGSAQERAVVGDTPNLAARLQEVARSGQVVVAEATRRLLGGAFETRDLGQLSLKGLSDPAPAFLVTAERAMESRFAARSAADPQLPEAPMIGRDAELGVMRDRWTAACAGQGQVVFLSGEAGIGKSRVVQGLIAAAPQAHAQIVWQCSPYHAETTLHPAIRQIARAAGFALGEDEAVRAGRLEALLARDGVSGAPAMLVAVLMGLAPPLPMSAAQARARTLDALILWLESMARRGPVLWVLEDAHWIDPTTLELVDLALERIAQARVLALVTARPTFQHGFGGHPIVTRLSLNRLGREAVQTIVGRITGGKPLPKVLLEEIAARTDGVPLYVEEMTKAMLESGVLRETAEAWVLDGALDRLAIPTSLHDSLMARLDRLQPVKEVAQTAAVIGRAFDHATLASLSPLPEAELGQALDRLVAAELVFRRGLAPDASYLFKHALVRDAAYESLLRSRRQVLHRKLVDILQAAGAEPELLAQHAQAGGETARAVTWWRAAAGAAVGRASFGEAETHLAAAEALLLGIEDDALRRREAAGVAVARALASLVQHGYSDARTVGLYATATALARVGDDPDLRVQAEYGVWAGHHVSEDVGAALGVAERLLDDATQATDGDMKMMALRFRAVTLTMAGRLDEGCAAFTAAEALYVPSRHRALTATTGTDPIVGIYSYRAMAELALGYPDRAAKMSASAQSLAKLTNSLNAHAYALWHMAAVAAYARRSERAIVVGRELCALSQERGMALWGALGPGIVGIGLLEAGDVDGALAEFARFLEGLEVSGAGLLVTLSKAAMAEAMARDGDVSAIATAEAAEAHARRTGALYGLAEAQRRRGVVLRLLRPDAQADAEAAFRAAMATAQAQNARLWELRAACDLVRLLEVQGRGSEGMATLQPLYGVFNEGFDSPDLADARHLIATLA
jgi:class 3 adenylate cyclase